MIVGSCRNFQLLAVVVLMTLGTAKATNGNGTDEEDPINWSVPKFIERIKLNVNRSIDDAFHLKIEELDELSHECLDGLKQYVVGMMQLKDWARKMYDSGSKTHAGFLKATLFGLGSYDECVNVIARGDENPEEEIFRGQYCLIESVPPRSLLRPLDVVANESGLPDFNTTFMKLFPAMKEYGRTFRSATAICVPSTCSMDDVRLIAKKMTEFQGYSPDVYDCDIKKEKKNDMNMVQIVVTCILASWGILIAVGTVIDNLDHRFLTSKLQSGTSISRRFIRALKALSLSANTKMFLKPPEEGRLGLLSGLRVFSITWVVLGHTIFSLDPIHYAVMKDQIDLIDRQYDLPFTVVQNTALSVDTFFLITGFLTVYTSWKRMDQQKGKLSAIVFLTRRFIRLIPAEMLMIGIIMIMPLVGNGPLWNSTWKVQVQNCKNLWWANLLSIQSLWRIEKLCLFHTWFLGVSMQFHIITFALILMLYRKPILGVINNVVLILASVISVSMLTLFKEYPPGHDMDPDSFVAAVEYSSTMYIHFYTHLGPYCVGVLLGFFVSKYPKKRINKMKWRIFCWMFFTMAGLAAVSGIRVFNGHAWAHQHPSGRVIYAGTFRTVWSVCVAWVIFDCMKHPKGIVNSFLCWSPFIYLDRLTFLVYLFHPIVIFYHQARLREIISTHTYDLVYYHLGNSIMSYAGAFVLHVTFEQPLNALDGVLFGKNKQDKKDCEPKENGTS